MILFVILCDTVEGNNNIEQMIFGGITKIDLYGDILSQNRREFHETIIENRIQEILSRKKYGCILDRNHAALIVLRDECICCDKE